MAAMGFLTHDARNIRDIVYPVVMKLEALLQPNSLWRSGEVFFFFSKREKKGNSLDRRQIWKRDQVSLCWNPPNKNVKSQTLKVSEFNLE